MKEIGLYIHIPFCKTKCFYCDFNSYKISKYDENEYIEALLAEIKKYIEKKQFVFKTVFIGGGTPTVIKYQNIGRLMEAITPYVKKGAEVTIECNPGTISKQAAKEYKAMGINRISIGLQAWQNKLLKTIGRIHSREEFLNSYNLLRDEGFENINVDLMFSLPWQTIDMWYETLKNVCKLRVEHISCYSLILEENTPIYSLIKSGKLSVPDEVIDRDMYHLSEKILSDWGYFQYEISNFARKGFKCSHNLIYWENDEYLGVGAGSHSKIGHRRFWNAQKIEQYIDFIKNDISPIVGYEDIGFDEDMWETIILGLRLNEGININDFNKRYRKDFMHIYGNIALELQNNGLLKVDKENIVLTSKGRDLSNIVFLKFSK